MKIIKWFLIILIALVAGFLFYSSTLPSQVIVSESITIDAKKSRIFSYLINYDDWKNWAVWNQLDSNMRTEYTGEAGTIGFKSEWFSDHTEVGNGSQEIVELIPNEYIKTKMRFEGWEEDNYSEFILTDKEGQTELKWTFEGAATPFFLNIMNTFIEPMLVESYQTSLKQLKEHIESNKTALKEFENIEITEVNTQTIAFIKDSTTADNLSKKLGELYTELAIYLEISGATIKGMPLAIYHYYSPEKVVLSAAMFIESRVDGNERVQMGSTPEGKVVKGIHFGSYDSSDQMHESIDAFAKERNLTIATFCWEVYDNDPTLVDSADIKTSIYYPIL